MKRYTIRSLCRDSWERKIHTTWQGVAENDQLAHQKAQAAASAKGWRVDRVISTDSTPEAEA